MSDSPGQHAADTAFHQLLGSRRGIIDPTATSELLMSTERELAKAHADMQRLEHRNSTLAREVQSLSAQLIDLTTDLETERDAAIALRADRDTLRYAAVWAGSPDPLIATEPEHQGLWTPGRPYLPLAHVYDEDANCWNAHVAPVPRGRRPGRSPLWARCDSSAACPAPTELTPPDQQHPVSSGWIFRQGNVWYDRAGVAWRIREDDADSALSPQSREHLLAVIDWLADRAETLWAAEYDWSPLRVPCPAIAYQPTGTKRASGLWLSDTPLMRALLAERRRRRIRRRRRHPEPDYDF